MIRRAPLACLAAAFAFVALAEAPSAGAQGRPDGAALVRLLGPRALDAFGAPGARAIGAIVQLPPGVGAGTLGLRDVAPGLGRLWGPPASVLAFADAHPDLRLEVSPPLHLLLDTAASYVGSRTANAQGFDGTGVLIGVADTGIDVTHGDFLDAQGHTRVAWLLDLSASPRGVHADLERKYGTTDAAGNVQAGAVWAAADIDMVRASGPSSLLPQDEVGHGTLVASCAAGNGLGGRSPYRGVAPNATLLIARIAGSATSSIGNDDLLRGVAFLFDRADALGEPVVVNLSIGTDFGPHDGTMQWEQALASHVGPQLPGHALVVAAGNSGSVVDAAVHEQVRVSGGATLRVPILTNGADNGGTQVWVAMHSGADLRVGLDAPDETWILPVGPGESGGKNTTAYSAGVFNGSKPAGSPVPTTSRGAVVAWQGKWPTGTYRITLSGTGVADLYVQATGDASVPGVRAVGFQFGVREGTINLPATAPSLIAVGCSINKGSWRSIDQAQVRLAVPVLDPNGEPDSNGRLRDVIDGEPCWFSSAGPTTTGIQKPELVAPGAAIVGALSQQAPPSQPSSIFNTPCPALSSGAADSSCQQIDAMHAVSFGTSFSAPLVAGAVAILLQRDPTMTEDAIMAALQGGSHRVRGPAPFDDQVGAGELDVVGSLTAAERLHQTQSAIPARSESWLTPGADDYLADGSTPLQAIVELRTAREGGLPPALADGFGDGRLTAYALVDGVAYPSAVQSLVRRGPGIWVVTVALPPGFGGRTLTVGATFDGVDVVDRKTVPIATDRWSAVFPARLRGGCTAAGSPSRTAAPLLGACGVMAVALRRRLVSRDLVDRMVRRYRHRRNPRRLDARGLPRPVKRELEEHGANHLVDCDGRDREGPKG
ncbi:MAG: S8 family serine peptidase [Myxococcota bacterium]|nr:S8 family serine peptidase [Myxococcota bacterium]